LKSRVEVLPQKGAAPKTGIREDLLRVRGAGPSEMTVEWDDRFAFSLRFERAFCKALCLGYSDTPLLRREIESLGSPRILRGHFLSGTDSGRVS
jgi:hypothetical protein